MATETGGSYGAGTGQVVRPDGETDTAFHAGQRFGGYRLTECVGVGASGEIWKAEDRHGNIVALKLLVRSPHAGRDQVRRFIREGNILSELRHQGICRTFEMRTAEGVLYIAMEHVDGISLNRLMAFLADPSTSATLAVVDRGSDTIGTIMDTLDRNTPPGHRYPSDKTTFRKSGHGRLLPLQQSLSIVAKLCAAIQFAHERGVLHRDIKPSNVMIRRNGEPVILDFGIAKVRTGGDPALTETGKVFGTIEYMAPEQARSSREIDERADIYSIGAILYQLVTGKKHFVRSGDLYRDVRRLEGYEPIRPRIHSRTIDTDLEAIILRALDPDPARRYRSARQLAEDLRRYQASEPIMARRATPVYLAWKFVAKNRLPVLFMGAIAFLAALFVGYNVWDYYRQWGRWAHVYHRDFTAAPYPAAEFLFLDGNRRPTQPWESDSLGLFVRRFETCWLRKVRVPGDVRVVVQLRFDDTPDGFELMINGASDSLRGRAEVPRGYSCQFGGYFGSMAVLSINEAAGPPSLTAFAYRQPRVGSPHWLTFERRGEDVTLFIDGKRILRHRHDLPFEGPDFSGIGFRCYTTTVHVLSLDVYHLGLPERVTPLVAGDALIAEGFWVKGVESYREVAEDYRGRRLGEEAMARALIAALRPGGSWHQGFVDSLKREFRRDYPRSRLSRTVDEAELLQLWDDRRFDEALGRLGPHCERHPDTDIAQRMLRAAPDSVKLRLLPFLRRLGRLMEVDVTRLDLSGLDDIRGCDLLRVKCGWNPRIEDLSPLGGMRNLRWLECDNNRITSLEPLRDKPIFYLNAGRNNIADVGPLAGAPLRFLFLAENRIPSIAPLASAPIRSLVLGHNLITDLTPLAGMPVVLLNISYNKISDISALRGLSLNQFSCHGNQIRSLAPLAGMPIRFLDCGENPIDDISALRGMPLTEMWITRARVTSLEPLAGAPLIEFGVAENKVESLAPLRGMNLSELDCSVNNISSLLDLQGIPLTLLSCGDNPLASLEGLESMPLRHLSVNNNYPFRSAGVASLGPLSGMNLKYLGCMNNRLTSLNALRGMQIDTVQCQGNPLRSLEPLVAHPPRVFHFYSETLPIEELERVARVWEKRAETRHLAREARIYIAIRRERWQDLQAFGESYAGRRYLFVPVWFSFDDGLACAERAGGTPAQLESLAEAEFVGSRVEGSIWLDIRRSGAGWVWGSGIPVDRRWVPSLERTWAEGRHAALTVKDLAVGFPKNEGLRPIAIEWGQARVESAPTPLPLDAQAADQSE